MSERGTEHEQERAGSAAGSRLAWIPRAIIGGLAILWLILALDLTREYSPTIDEVPHAGSGWAMRSSGDFRVNPEHPPLWKLLSALPHSPTALPDGLASPLWPAMTSSFILEWAWSANLLYGENPRRGVEYIQRARWPIIMFGLLLGTVIVWWALRLGGPFAAVLAGALFALEPNLLAHSSILTSDVPFTATLFLMLHVLLRCDMSRRRWLYATAVGLALGVCLATKFSALVLPPIVAGLILLQPFLSTTKDTRRTLRASVLILLIIALVSFAVLWMSYGFRFSPSPGGERLDLSHAVAFLEHKASETGSDAGGPIVSVALFAERHQLLPQAYCVGLVWAKATTLGQPAFLLGETSSTGWWYYFPVALLVKLPTILIIALIGAMLLVVRNRKTYLHSAWNRSVLLLAPATLLIIAMGSGLNIGVRHVFPVVPALIIFTAVVIAGAIRAIRHRAIILSIVLLFGTAELLVTHPGELSYFNLLSGGSGRGIQILGDSNLDWGQDLVHLGRWSAEHPCTRIHLAYYGSTPPEAFGVTYDPLPVREGAAAMPPLQTEGDEVLIVSSRYLQGFELNPEVRPFYEMLRDTEPTDIIGTTLYVYRIGPQASCAGG